MSTFDAELPAAYLDDLLEDRVDAVAGTTPVLFNLDPEIDETFIVKSTDIRMDIGTIDTGSSSVDIFETRVFINDEIAFDRGVFVGRFNGPNSTIFYPQSDVLRLRIDPTFDFDSESYVHVRVISKAVGDVNGLDQTYVFQIEDYLGPRILSAQAVDLNRVRVTFSESLTASTALDVASWQLDRFGDYVAPIVYAKVVNAEMPLTTDTVDLITDIPLTPGGVYQATAFGVYDAHGNVITAPFNFTQFAGWQPPVPEGRSFDLYRKFADMNRSEDDTLDLLRLVGCIQEVANLLLFDIDNFIEIVDPDTAPEDVVDTMLLDLGNPFSFDLTLIDKRRLANVLVAMYQLKGTGPGVKNVIRFFLGFEIDIDAYNTPQNGWTLGVSELGVDSTLTTTLQEDLYSFEIIVGRTLLDEERARLRTIVEYMKPCHTHFKKLVEPVPPVVTSEFAPLGEASLGADWLLSTTPYAQTISPSAIYSFEYLGLPGVS